VREQVAPRRLVSNLRYLTNANCSLRSRTKRKLRATSRQLAGENNYADLQRFTNNQRKI